MFMPNKKQTIEHLKEIKDEVKELHPILNVLFGKLPGIDRVHYNQGNNELGADFILFKNDLALRRTTCIGVVVKSEKIGQNTAEVERQIKECFVLRKTTDATEIQIREVWVISSQDISRNAREVLNKLYSDRKIEFIAAQDLAGMIEEYAPDAFTSTSPALQSYAEQLHAVLSAEEQRSLVVPGLDAFYVEPNVFRVEFNGYGHTKSLKKVSSLDDLLKTLSSAQLSIIEAGAGGGKSRISRELIRATLALADYSDGKLVPKNDHVKNCLDRTSESLSEALKDVRARSTSDAHVLFFLDGFDEVDLDEAGRKGFVEDLVRTAAADDHVSFVLLSRPFDEASILGARAHAVDIFRIDPLKGGKAIEFLCKVAGQLDVKSKLVKDLGNSLLLRTLEGAPIAYILLGRLIAENQQELPSNLTELYQKYIELVLGRWEIAKGLRSQQEYEILVESLIWVSGYMLDNQIAEISRSELETWISEYCRERGIEAKASDLVDKLCERNSILFVRQDISSVGFRHRAFSEFFYAKGLGRKIDIELSTEIFSPYWLNSYFFLTGLKRDCPELLESLLTIELEEESRNLLRIMNFGHFLLAGYLTPKVVSKRSIIKIANDIASIYVHACDPRSTSALTFLPTLQLLGTLNTVFKSQYGYGFFREALEGAVFEIESGPRTESNAFALFFLDSAYKEAGGALRFDDLIERFGDSLPLVVKLAIDHESKQMKCISDRVKRMERNLRRAFAGNKGSREFLRKLYEVPIRKLDKKLS